MSSLAVHLMDAKCFEAGKRTCFDKVWEYVMKLKFLEFLENIQTFTIID